MRPKARGMNQHGGPPGWLEESDRLPKQELPSCELMEFLAAVI